jgi:micrococcal nuclease
VKFSTLALSTLFVLALYSYSVATAQTMTGTVSSITDCDTVKVKTSNGTLTVRTACTDSPESDQPGGSQATARLRQLLPVGQAVTLNVVDTDRYGRSVAEIYKGNNLVNLWMVQEGKAVIYPKYLHNCPENAARLQQAESQARQKRLGFWGQSNSIMPWEWRSGRRPSNNRTTTSSSRPSRSNQPNRNNLPTCVNSDCDCSDFSSQQQAQQVLGAFRGDPFQLDGDRDGIACESLR